MNENWVTRHWMTLRHSVALGTRLTVAMHWVAMDSAARHWVARHSVARHSFASHVTHEFLIMLLVGSKLLLLSFPGL